MPQTRIVTPGTIAGIFGFFGGLIGSIDDDSLLDNTITGVIEAPANGFSYVVENSASVNLVGQQTLVGATFYFLKDLQGFDTDTWIWPISLLGTDLEDAFNAATTVKVIFNMSSVNTILNSAINSDINTPIPFPPHFDSR